MYQKEVTHQKAENAKLRDTMKKLIARRPADFQQSINTGNREELIEL